MSDPRNYRPLLAEPRSDASGVDRPSPHDEPPPAGSSAALDLVRVQVQPDPTRAGEIGALDVFERFAERVDELGASIADVATRLRTSLESRLAADRSDRWQMSQVVVEFGVNLEAQAGITVCQGKYLCWRLVRTRFERVSRGSWLFAVPTTP
jgi:hypothetical protein